MKRTPSPRPPWIRTCSISHRSGNIIDFAVIDDLSSLLWLVNLGCIDLNPWYSLCDDVDRPVYIHFDMDPTAGTAFSVVREGALIVRDVLRGMGMKPFVKTTGRRACTSTSPSAAARRSTKCGRLPRRSAIKSRARIPTSSPRSTASLSAHITACWSTTTRTPGDDARLDLSGAGRIEAADRFDAGDVGGTRSRLRDRRLTVFNVPERVARIGDLWKPLLSDRKRFVLNAI